MAEVRDDIIDEKQDALDAAVAEGGAYEILRRRLQELGARLQSAVRDLNQRRLAEFGQSELEIVGRVRIRPETTSPARSIAPGRGASALRLQCFYGP